MGRSESHEMTIYTINELQHRAAGAAGLLQSLPHRKAAQRRHSLEVFADIALKATARFWFLVAVIGQWIFVVYIVSFYGGAAVRGDLARWGQGLRHAYVPGYHMGNFVLAMHLVLAVIVTVGGPLQLIPQLRACVPAFHRWNGRVYLLTTFTISITALYLMWIRGGTAGGAVLHAGASLNAVLIMFCAAMALRYALARKFDVHRRWALRLFLVVSGFWFFRVGLMLWIILNKGPVGFNPETLQGPFLDFLSFAGFLPLAVLEIYLRVRDRTGAPGKFAMAASLLVLTVAMGIGIFGATTEMWLPRS